MEIKFEIQPVLLLENAVRAANRHRQQIHVHFGGELFGFLDAHRRRALAGGVRAFDDVADFRLDADAQRSDEVDDFLRAANVFFQRLIGVINHHMGEAGFDRAEDRLRSFAVIQRDGHRDGRVGGEKFDQRAREIVAAVFQIGFVALDDERRLQVPAPIR